MSLSSSVSADGRTLQIEVGERFDFSLHTLFRAAQESAPRATEFVVDLRNTGYMDSSALGMLLVLHDWAKKTAGQVRVRNCRPLVLKILKIANFDKLFVID